MKTVGLITEYNPFHLGHKYHIERAKELTGADNSIVIMSGNYVQRGTPSFVDKYTKTRVAINNGADLIIELPFCFACASAEYFAYSAVSILDKLNITDYLCFGSENDDIALLSDIADILSTEPPEYRNALKEYLKSGCSFPLARQNALIDYISKEKPSKSAADIKVIKEIVKSPNNILGIEYIKALKKRNSSIVPVCFKRINAGYHDTDVSTRFYSATAIRENDDLHDTLKSIDAYYMENYNKTYPVLPDLFSGILGASLITHLHHGTLEEIFGVSKDLTDRISNNIDNFIDFTSFTDTLKTKELSHTAISRALLHIMLNITKNDIADYISNDIADYIRVLGFNKKGAGLLGNISKKSDMAILTKMSDSTDLLKDLPSHNKRLFDNWLYADSLYRMTGVNKYNFISQNEFNRKLITL